MSSVGFEELQAISTAVIDFTFAVSLSSFAPAKISNLSGTVEPPLTVFQYAAHVDRLVEALRVSKRATV